jgi:hypothetical protein
VPPNQQLNSFDASPTQIREAEQFVRFWYSETKDLCKHFLTIVSATLAFSVTFAEKVVGVQGGMNASLWLLLFAWVLLVIAVVACGVGLLHTYRGGITATHHPERIAEVVRSGVVGTYYTLTAGTSFVIALLLLAGAAFLKLLRY